MARALGWLDVAFLAAAAALWVLLVAGLASLGREDPAGRGLASPWLLAAVILLWLVLGGLLVLGNRTGAAPAWAGQAALLLHPVSGAAAVWAVAMLVDREPAWLVVVPAGASLLIAALALWELVPSVRSALPPTTAALAWGGVVILSLLPLPVRLTKSRRDEVRQAARSAVAAREAAGDREEKRAALAARLAAFGPDTALEAWLELVWPPNEASPEALARARTSPRRQADAERLVGQGLTLPLRFGDELALAPTAGLCRAAVLVLVRNARDLMPREGTPPPAFDAVASRFEFYRPAVEWVARRCDGAEAVAAFEKTARAFLDSPERARFLASLEAHKTH